jgi:hypothetical protein
MIKRAFKITIGIIMLPASYAFAHNLFKQLSGISSFGNLERYFFYGIASYVIIHIVFFKPNYLYVLGHESLHAIATWICGGKVTSFKVSSSGGSIETTRSNFFVALAPYLFPFYTIFFSALFSISTIFFSAGEFLSIFLFLTGLSLCFHIIMTIEMIKKRQQDIAETGYLFSINLIFICNVIVVGLIFSLLFSQISFADFFVYSFVDAKRLICRAFNQIFVY